MTIDMITENSIKTLVDNFYQKVRKDSDLAPIFVTAIGETEEAWRSHLEHMYAFWSSIMLSSGRYQGNPIQKHSGLPSFDENLFVRWLELFAETATELHCSSIAEQYIEKSKRIAESLKLSLYYKPRRIQIDQSISKE